MNITNDWGVPDWQDASAYPQPTGRGRMLVWAWEFLRRNPDYRRFWIEKAARLVDGEGFISNEAGPVIREAEERFGIILFPLDPTSATLPKFRATAIKSIHSNSAGLPSQIVLKPHEEGYIFDLTSPLEGQFLRALQDAKSVQDLRVKQGKIEFHNPRDRSDKYQAYLRIIDAGDANIDQNKVAEIMFPKLSNNHPDYQRIKTFRNHRDAAMRLRDADYGLLAALAISPARLNGTAK